MKALFQNPKMALAYVGITLVSVAIFVGTEDSPGTVGHFGDAMTAQDRAAQRKFGDPPPGSEPASGDTTIGRKKPKRDKPDEDAPVTFATDEELMDSAEGFGAKPEVFRGFDPDSDPEAPFLSDQDDDGNFGGEFGGWGAEAKKSLDDD